MDLTAAVGETEIFSEISQSLFTARRMSSHPSIHPSCPALMVVELLEALPAVLERRLGNTAQHPSQSIVQRYTTHTHTYLELPGGPID